MFTEKTFDIVWHKNSRGLLFSENTRTGLIQLGCAYLDKWSDCADLRRRAAEESAAAEKARIEKANALRAADSRSIFSRTPFGTRISKSDYRAKPASKAWIEANRL